jgi:peptidyl-prolyl cis-trans isomerase A (cyclophilin A)
MKRILLCLTILSLLLAAGPAPAANQTPAAGKKNPQVVFKTSKGKMTIELFADRAPVTVRNFLAYVNSGFYNGTIFHRVIPGFVIQGGGFTTAMERKNTRPPIKNEADNGLRNRRYTLSMARTSVVDSATSQFFINLRDNPALDHRPGSFGYAVFGRVVKGQEVVDAIAGVPTGSRGHYRDVPLEPVVIENATVKK